MSGIFDGLFGNTATKERLCAAIRSQTLPHAFLIDGAVGSGKMTLALEIAAALNCENKESSTHALPCRRCNTCRRIFEGAFTDLKFLDKPKDKATIGVELVKLFKEDMFLTAGESNYKIYVIKNAHLLTPQAQNALLTVMEEPPSGVFILLLSSSSDKILTTIKSRAQYVAMQRFSKDELSDYLTKNVPEASALYKTSPERFFAVIMRAEGTIGQAKELFSPALAKEAEAERARALKFIAALDVRAPFSELYAVINELPSERVELVRALEEIILALADMIKSKFVQSDAPCEFFESVEAARAAAKAISQKRLFAISELLYRAHEHLSKNASAKAVMSSLAAKIKLL